MIIIMITITTLKRNEKIEKKKIENRKNLSPRLQNKFDHPPPKTTHPRGLPGYEVGPRRTETTAERAPPRTQIAEGTRLVGGCT